MLFFFLLIFKLTNLEKGTSNYKWYNTFSYIRWSKQVKYMYSYNLFFKIPSEQYMMQHNEWSALYV